ncbi:tRNA 2-selenouridine(34) synthase MnmH [Neobacillus citreus]|uniref:tRNA 2-selenouridine(34) synthase MnmH n=1 Tax=Neobacillus citreus TaxID=2833578 RepID=A0A942YB68_9BACI|nr:tRNA 2-selenouridine(34) synthase MnmH [Neobacillus citreus]MCH6267485.1 tRNA 2-selenouridine(34) synthase MnmH [Neobacillus citreus]
MKEITVEDLLNLSNPIIIDVRSPIEFNDGAIAGAINVPLFSNEERQEIGTIYKHEGQAAAKWRAMELVSPKLPRMLNEIKSYSEKGELVVYCWRGGMRSKAVATFLEFAGIYAWRLIGGYKAHRHFILEKIPAMVPNQAVVIHGMTGVGKTEVLKQLKKQGYPILDLEEMAAHRGSIFGTIGLNEGNNQKTFDSLLFDGLREIQGADYFLVEAESKRIGKAVQPEELMDIKFKGLNIYIHSPLEQRVKHLVSEYVLPYKQEPWFHEKISLGIEKVIKRVKDIEIKNTLLEYLEERNYRDMISILLEHYYDPRYTHARQDYIGDFYDIFAKDPSDAAEKIALKLKELSFSPVISVNS